MYILGINGGFRVGNRNATACLIRDNSIIAAAEEERFTRIKHAPGVMPINAVKYCLREAGISIRDIDYLVFAGSTYKNIKEKLSRFFNFKLGHCPKIILAEHHIAHAASAFFVSGFEDAGILTMDLSGDGVSTMMAHGKGNKIIKLREFLRPNSLGAFYNIITQYLGFERHEGDYKVMGLASYGKSDTDLSWLLKKTPSGYIFNEDAMVKVLPTESFPSFQEPLYTKKFLKRFPYPRLPNSKITRYHQNFAASAQKQLEDIICHLAKILYEMTGCRNICIAGGVGLNCVANAKLRSLSFIDNIFVQPASSDSGLAMGGALTVAVDNGFKFNGMEHAYYGPGYSNEDIEACLKDMKCSYKFSNNISSFVARKLSEGNIIGWVQGRMEYGPRALGARSILADPRSKNMKARINKIVKFREPFRPFAPSVLAEYAHEYFVDSVNSPFMTINFTVNKSVRRKIPAVVHVDGTSRIQTVTADTNPKYYNMIKEFYRITSTPLVLNTSFNVRGQPIVCSPYHAVSTFYATGLDYLAIGDFILQKAKKKI